MHLSMWTRKHTQRRLAPQHAHRTKGCMCWRSALHLPLRGSHSSELARCLSPSNPPTQIMLPFSAADARAKRRVPMGFTVVHLSLMGSYLRVTSITNGDRWSGGHLAKLHVSA